MGHKKLILLCALIFVLIVGTIFAYWQYQKNFFDYDLYIQRYIYGENTCVNPSQPMLEKAFQEQLQLANQGQTHAEFIAGFSYLNGIGTTQDVNKGVAMIQDAAQKNDPLAQAVYGSYSETQLKKLSDAITWYKRSANAGNPYGKYTLAISYSLGVGVEQNSQEYLQMMNSIIPQFPLALYSLGYAAIMNTNPDSQMQGIKWLTQAYNNKDLSVEYRVDAAENIAMYYQAYQDPHFQSLAKKWFANAQIVSKYQCGIF